LEKIFITEFNPHLYFLIYDKYYDSKKLVYIVRSCSVREVLKMAAATTTSAADVSATAMSWNDTKYLGH
jgi:hypothetical protein